MKNFIQRSLSLSLSLSLSVNPRLSISERFKASTKHILNSHYRACPDNLDPRVRLSVTPEYDNRKNFIKGLDVVRQYAALLERRVQSSTRVRKAQAVTRQTNPIGRSMIEMLGVLAIIGVLIVGGIAGYSKAMMKFKINKTAEQISQIVTNIRTLYLQQKDYNGLGNSSAIQMGAIPDDLTIDSSGNIKNIFGGTIWIHTSTSSYAWHNSVGDTDDAFIITIYNLPKEACVALATMDWGTSSTGLIAVSVNDDGFSNSTYNFPKCNGYSEQRYVAGCPGDSTVSVPIPVSLAATACNYWSSPNFNLMFY